MINLTQCSFPGNAVFVFFNYCFVMKVIVSLIIRIFVGLSRYGISVPWEAEVGLP